MKITAYASAVLVLLCIVARPSVAEVLIVERGEDLALDVRVPLDIPGDRHAHDDRMASVIVAGVAFRVVPDIPGDIPLGRVAWSVALPCVGFVAPIEPDDLPEARVAPYQSDFAPGKASGRWSGTGQEAEMNQAGPGDRPAEIPCLEGTADSTVMLVWDAGSGMVGILEIDELGPAGDARLVHGYLESCADVVALLDRADRE
jgi:hypothetical protein